MQIIADLHIHSKYARATSPKSDIEGLSEGAKRKGVNLLGTGDYTHPKYFNHLKEKLKKDPETGFYIHNKVYFVPTVEVSTEYRENEDMKKIHHLVLTPDLETAEQVNDVLSNHQDLSEDGRPRFTFKPPELVEILKEVSEKNLIIPAHAWTPHYSIFGSNSGYDSIEECYKDQTKHIHALETGLSSDPAMNWRLSSLDEYTLVSNSDSHSPYTYRLGREANVFELENPSYESIIDVIKKEDTDRFKKTLEFYPQEGKYHWDGHRDCELYIDPKKAMNRFNNICPTCGEELTLGVMHRVEELADREPGYKPEGKVPYVSLIPLQKIISIVTGKGLKTKTVKMKHDKLLNKFESELNVLLNAPFEEIEKEIGTSIAEAIKKTRKGELNWRPGYDGVYGEPIFNEGSMGPSASQSILGDF